MTIEKEKLQKVVLICVGAIVFTVLYYSWVMGGIQLRDMSELNRNIASYQTRLNQGHENQKQLGSLVISCRRDEPFLAAHEPKIVKGDHVAWLWTEMGDFGAKQKMNRLAVMPEGAIAAGLPENSDYQHAAASLSLFCGYHKLGQFVQDMENSYSTLQIQYLEILGGTTASPDTHTVRIQFQLLASRNQPEQDSDKNSTVAEAPLQTKE